MKSQYAANDIRALFFTVVCNWQCFEIIRKAHYIIFPPAHCFQILNGLDLSTYGTFQNAWAVYAKRNCHTTISSFGEIFLTNILTQRRFASPNLYIDWRIGIDSLSVMLYVIFDDSFPPERRDFASSHFCPLRTNYVETFEIQVKVTWGEIGRHVNFNGVSCVIHQLDVNDEITCLIKPQEVTKPLKYLLLAL